MAAGAKDNAAAEIRDIAGGLSALFRRLDRVAQVLGPSYQQDMDSFDCLDESVCQRLTNLAERVAGESRG